MATGKITKTTVERLQGGEWIWDGTVKGFGARRQRDGVFYYLRYRLGGLQRMKSIGRHGSPWTPDTARKQALVALGKVAAGLDPFVEERQARSAETFGGEVDRYLERKRSAMKPRSFEEVERHLTNHAGPLTKLKLAEIDRRTIAVRLAEIEADSGPVARNRVRSSLSAFFAWAIAEGFIEINPVSGTGKADEGGSRERVLADGELAQVWRALRDDQFSDIVRLLILTAQRREEIGALRWDEVDFERGVIVLGPERTKNRRQHELPLSPQAKVLIERQPRRNREFVFGYGVGAFSGWSDCKAALDNRLAGARGKPLPDWRLHDIRRTVATMMAERLGVLPHIIEAVLNHVSGHKAGVAGIYNRATYASQMQEALERWADYVGAITK
jgi:integrase